MTGASVKEFKCACITWIFFLALYALLVWHKPSAVPRVEVSAQVIAHDLQHPLECTRLVSDGNTIESSCWKAHVTHAYRFEDTDRNCTALIYGTHTKRKATSILLETYPVHNTSIIYLLPDGDCSLVFPPQSYNDATFVWWLMCVRVVILNLFLITVVAGILWEWHGTAVKAWCWRMLRLTAGGGAAVPAAPAGGAIGGGGGFGGAVRGRRSTDKKTDRPLVASAPLP